MAGTDEVAGRYRPSSAGSTPGPPPAGQEPGRLAGGVRPAGARRRRPWSSAINARIADGKDPSWLWDVPFERLAGRLVVAIGERSRDLAVRLHYADVEHRHQPDPRAAPSAAAGASEVDVVANYTSFQAAARPARRMPPDGDRRPCAVALVYPGPARHLRRLRQRRHPGPAAALAGHRTPRSSRSTPAAHVPDSCDLYVVGGGEDLPQSLAARELNAERSAAPSRGAGRGRVRRLRRPAGPRPVSFVGPDGVDRPGLGLLDCVSTRGQGRGQSGSWSSSPTAEPSLPLLSGYENHGATTTLGPAPRPPAGCAPALAMATASTPRASSPATSGAPTCTDRPWPATRPWPISSCRWVVGPLQPLDDGESDALRSERLRAAGPRLRRGPSGTGVAPSARAGPPPSPTAAGRSTTGPSTALYTDEYELTMLDAALGPERPATA